jgi:two-component system NtrC family sensor kinase
MKLVLKFMGAVMVVVAILLTIHGYLVVEREIDLFQTDMIQHADLLGEVLVPSIYDVWQSDGFERVQDVLRDVDKSEDLVSVRWVWLNAPPGDPYEPVAARKGLAIADTKGQRHVFRYHDAQGADYLYAYFPVPVDSTRPSALEISQPMAPMYAYIRNTVVRKVVLFLAFVTVGGLLVLWLGAVMVGRPVQSMAEQARRVGDGDLTARTDAEKHRDELAELAHGLNQMAEHLEVSRNRLQEEMAHHIETLEQLHHAERLATVGKLASGLAHELGTPLNVVSGRAQMIASENMNQADIVGSASVIKEQAERMTRIIRQLLDFARSRKPLKHRTKLGALADQALTVLSPVVSQRGVGIRREYADGDITVDVDQDQIHQVIYNLVVNAMQAMPDGGDVEIAVRCEHITPPADHGGSEGEYACLKVIDGGVGIREEDMSRIFTPFFTTKGIGEGTGLGLSISHGIVREHDGWMAVESTEGQGSCFSLYLPLVRES